MEAHPREVESGSAWRLANKALPAALVVLALAAGIALYAPTLPGGFLADDYWYIDQAQTIRLTEHPLLALRKGNFYYLRPLTSAAWSALYSVFEFRAPLYRASSLGLHLLAVLSFYLLAYRVLKSRGAAGLSAVAFAVFPLHAEAVAWVSSNADLFAAIFFALAVERWLAWRGSEGPGRAGLGLCFILGFLAMASKEAAYVLPVVLLCGEVLPGRKRSAKQRRNALILMFVMAIAFSGARTVLSAGQLRPPTGATPLSWMPGNLGMSLLGFLAPAARESAAFPVNTGIMSCLGLLLICALARRRGLSQLGFGLLFLLAALLPPASVARVGPHLEFSRTLYLPSLGFAVALGALLGAPFSSRGAGVVRSILAAALVALLFSAASLNIRPWVSAGAASRMLTRNFKEAVARFEPGQSALVEGVPVVIRGVPFHSNSYTLSVAASVSGFPQLFKQRGFEDRKDLPFYAVSANTPEIEAKMTPIKRLRVLKMSGPEAFDYRMEWDSTWAKDEE